jgi:probable HAF family extracellular repeat protein
MQILKPLESGNVSLAGINNPGQIIGYRYEMSNAGVRAFIYSGGSLQDLDSLGGNNTQARAINDKGNVVGAGYTKEGYNHAFLYSGGKMQDLGTLGGWESYAEAINDKGQIVGGADPEGSTDAEFSYISMGATQVRSESMWLHAFVYSDGKMRDLGQPSGGIHFTGQQYCSHAYGINDSGQIVGVMQSNGPYGGMSAFLYSNGKMIDLNTRVDLARSRFKNLMSAKAINDAGQIVGEGPTDSGMHVFLLTPLRTIHF